ncbi:hypothetical protein ASJ81_06270 [Methanosarcina spelaei]|uniref:NB-ARC domain-containing protein n=1 Tax=Methanosarcina spelaei TaxID=1036679 RepID=A0A2A2HT66_9EURY|nr:NB-ARC domain-containing protein [Methanosarcina spelaei]PAV12485.1 hypothetical protein ASJ81_06270 [Methanosarcina spelaei]
MTETNLKTKRNYGYDILCNTFELSMRNYIGELLLSNYGSEWINHIPQGVIQDLKNYKGVIETSSLDDFLEDLNFSHLKNIITEKNNYKLSKSFLGDLSNDRFIELMDELNIYRRKIAHVKSTFSDVDLINLIENVKLLCQGERAKSIIAYVENEEYKSITEIPDVFFERFECQNNLPSEDYDLVGGFVGREKEIKALKKMITSEQDRIITITGAGGIGKTSIALKIGYSFLFDLNNPFDAIIWFSAKKDKLTEDGIVPIIADIENNEKLIVDILKIIEPDVVNKFKKAGVPSEYYSNYLYSLFSSNKCLLIIDNLETIITDNNIIDFIKDVPRPSQVLITSRKGLGEIERRYPLFDMAEKDAIRLFRLIANERQKIDLVKLSDENIAKLVKKVKCYPLLIKWSIGQVILGKSIDEAFSEILAGDSEIAKFSFNDVFSLLSKNSKRILFSMVVSGDKPVSKIVLKHLANISDEEFEDAIRELIITSFVFPETRENSDSDLITEYSMLSLTRGFIEIRLDDNNQTRQELITRLHHLSEKLNDYEKAKSDYSQSLFSLGIKTPEEKVAFIYAKTAKNYIRSGDMVKAEENFNEALKMAPNFSYVLVEFSKFEFNRNHIPNALKLSKKAVENNSDSYHTWFNYGLMLQKNKQYNEAIMFLTKAKEINPNHLPIYTELGRTYSFKGCYELAEVEFTIALKEEKYPNYKHKVIAFYSMAENYRRWAQSFQIRGDSDGQIEKLKQASDKIYKAIIISKKDGNLWNRFREIYKDLGIAITYKEGFEKGKPYLEKCLELIELEGYKNYPSPNILRVVCYYLAKFYMKEGGKDEAQIEYLINRGLNNCDLKSDQYEKLQGLKKRLESTKRKTGFIKFYNVSRKFGVIKDNDISYLFFKSSFMKWITDEELAKVDGKKVSFIPSMSKQKKLVATEVLM